MNTPIAVKLALAACLGACVTVTAPIVWPKPHAMLHQHKRVHVIPHQHQALACPPSDFVTPALRPLDGPEPMTWAPGSPDWPVGVTRPHPAPEPATWALMGGGWVLTNVGLGLLALRRSRT